MTERVGSNPRKSTGFFSARRLYVNILKYEMTERVVPLSGFAWRNLRDAKWDCLHTRHAGVGSQTKKRTSSRAVVYPERALWSDRLALRAPVGLRQPEAGRLRIRYVALLVLQQRSIALAAWFANTLRHYNHRTAQLKVFL